MTSREQISRVRSLPIRWFDLVTFDNVWLGRHRHEMYLDEDGVYKPRVFDADGKQVYPCE